MKKLAIQKLLNDNIQKTIKSRNIKLQVDDWYTLVTAHENVTAELADESLSLTKREAKEVELGEIEATMEELDKELFPVLRKYFENYEKDQEKGRKLAEANRLKKEAAARAQGGTVADPVLETSAADQNQTPDRQFQPPPDQKPVGDNTAANSTEGTEPAKEGGGWLTAVLFIGFGLLTFGMVKANMENKY